MKGKVRFGGGQVRNGKILLTTANLQYLGGEVSQLLEAYKANIYAQNLRKLGLVGDKISNSTPPKFELNLSSSRPAAVKEAWPAPALSSAAAAVVPTAESSSASTTRKTSRPSDAKGKEATAPSSRQS